MSCCNDKKSQLAEVGTSKDLEGLICYCFHHSRKELYEAILNSEEEKIINDIKSKMKDPGCFCESSNPSGKCCMTDIVGFINHFKK